MRAVENMTPIILLSQNMRCAHARSPANQKTKLSSENPKVIFTPHGNISTVDNNTFSKLISDIDYRVLVISDLQESYDEAQLYDNSRISFGIKDKSNLNKLNITQNNIPKEKRIVLLNQTKYKRGF